MNRQRLGNSIAEYVLPTPETTSLGIRSAWCFLSLFQIALLPKVDLPIVEETVLGPQFWMPPMESFEVSGVATWTSGDHSRR